MILLGERATELFWCCLLDEMNKENDKDSTNDTTT